MNSLLQDWNVTQSLNEGWYLQPVGAPKLSDKRIEVHALVRGPFWGISISPEEPDEKALAFVKRRAAEGSAYHIDALARIQLL